MILHTSAFHLLPAHSLLPLLVLGLATGCAPSSSGDDTHTSAVDTSDPATDDTATDDTGQGSPAKVTINEFQPSNSTTIEDESGAYPDWIELYNYGDVDIDLDGFTITDDLDEPDKFTLSELSIPAGGFMLLWADGGDVDAPDHLTFNLSKEGEEIGLYDDNGLALCRLRYEENGTDWSAARIPDASDNWETTADPTPGNSNASKR